MAIRKHAMTKEGAIIALTRHQVEQSGGKKPIGISKTFLDVYLMLNNSGIEALYKETFGFELEIVKERKNGKQSEK